MDANALAVLAFLALLVRSGHALHVLGAVRARSVADAAIRALVGTAVVVLGVYLGGRLISLVAVTPDTWSGFGLNRSAGVEGPAVFFATPLGLLQVIAVALVPAALVESATAERARLTGGAIVAAVVALAGGAAAIGVGLAIVAYVGPAAYDLGRIWPVAAAHVVGGAGAIAAASALGARAAKYNRDGSANFIPPHNLAWLVAGDLLLIVGLPALAGVVAGDVSARLANTLLAASAAVIFAAIACHARERRIDVVLVFAAAVAGAVAGSLSTPEWHAVAIGLGAILGAVVPAAAIKLDLRFRVDDPSGLALVHLVGGVAGTLSASLGGVTTGGSFAWREVPVAFGVGLAGIVIAVLLGAIVGGLAALLLRRANLLRIADAIEGEGVDLALHDVNAYPDFQQTMIKSYHLRQ